MRKQRSIYRRPASLSPFVPIVKKVNPSVVNIQTEEKSKPLSVDPSIWGMFFSEPSIQQEKTTHQFGAGFFIHSNGYILTNAHVIQDASTILIRMNGYNKPFPASVIWIDQQRDLAIVKISPPHPVKPIKLGTSKHTAVGEWVVAIGNPFGLDNTVTVGILSGKNRSIQSEGRHYVHMIQTDAAINPGNSGGPLLNLAGEVIGINTIVIYPSQNIGFAIPIEKIKTKISQIIKQSY